MTTIVRTATLADYTYFARLFPELGTGDSVATEARWRDEIVQDVLVLEDEGDVVGYTFAQQLAETGYIRHLVVDPRDRRKGYGRRLLSELRARLRAAGRTSWCLNVDPGNPAAVALYESVGMRFAYHSSALHLLWSRAKRSTDTEVVVQAFGAEEDATLERTFSLPLGQVADHRAKPERIFLKATKHGELQAIAVFDRLFPGLYPLRSRSIDAAWKLLEAVHINAKRGDDHIRLLVEDDDALRDALVDAGAESVLTVDHYRSLLD